MGRTNWRDGVEQTQATLREAPDYCFVCQAPVPDADPGALIQAYLDAAHQQRLAAVCGRRACRLVLQDRENGTWQRLFDALTHWPDTAIHPHGPYWRIRRPHQLTFRTTARRTTVSTTVSPDDPDDAASLPATENRSLPHRPLIADRRLTRRPGSGMRRR